MDIISTAQKMSEKLKEMTTSQLIEEFIKTGKNSGTTPTIRAWIVYELERRDPEAFRAWLDSEDYADDESVKKYFN